jgi:pilus assembly protein Flp/PilA
MPVNSSAAVSIRDVALLFMSQALSNLRPSQPGVAAIAAKSNRIGHHPIFKCRRKVLAIGPALSSQPYQPAKGLPMHILKQFLNDESGATAIEYGLIAALIAVVIITGVTAVGTSLSTTFTNISGNLR